MIESFSSFSFSSFIVQAESLLNLLPWMMLYPETHYRFRFFPFSLYYRREPEILFDVPHRIEPGHSLPVLLMIRDAHRFPLKLSQVIVKPDQGDPITISLNTIISDRWWYAVWEYPVPDEWRGRTIGIQTELLGFCGKKKIQVCQDNLTGLSHCPFQVHLAREPLPYDEGWIAGDMHVHSDYTFDQVEFGVPLTAMQRLASACGLSFAAVNDHSYDLDDEENQYLKNDPSLPKWKKFQNEIARLNAQTTNFILIPGEEVTARNQQGKNVHCLILYEPTFIPGSGDSAEKWFHTRSEYALTELPALVSEKALIIAAHPMEPVPILQRWLIGRGNWTPEDCALPSLHGLQILNGFRDKGFYAGLQQWIRRLLKGEKKFIFGGNDAHGNFNRYRQVRIPMIRLIEKENYQLFGRCRTYIKLGHQPFSPHTLQQAIQQGRAVVSDGPFLDLMAETEDGSSAWIGDTICSDKLNIQIRCRSTSEFGIILSVSLRLGQIGHNEKILAEWKPDHFFCNHSVTIQKAVKGYVRAELETRNGHFAYTNPIWFQPPS